MKSKNIRKKDKSELYSKNSNDHLPNKRLVLIKLDKKYNVENDTNIKKEKDKDKKINNLNSGRNESLNSQKSSKKNQIIKIKNKNISPMNKRHLNNAYKNKIFRTTCDSSGRSVLSSETNKHRNKKNKDINNISFYNSKPLTMSFLP